MAETELKVANSTNRQGASLSPAEEKLDRRISDRVPSWVALNRHRDRPVEFRQCCKLILAIGKGKIKRRTASGFGVHPNSTAVTLDNFVTDG